MAVWRSPSIRQRGEPQTEFCDLCGCMVGAARLVQCEVQGLQGAWVCDLHPMERLHRSNPSFQDLGGVSNNASYVPPLPLPHGGTDWTGGSW